MLQDGIRVLSDNFVRDMVAIVREAVEDAILERDATAGSAVPKRRAGEKRSPREIDRLTKRLLAYVLANPGQRIEAIGEGMRIHTSELKLPMKRLLEAKAVRTKGQKRATTYHAVGK